ncbi:hypothetical protein J7J81_01335 [bacterium]|nr:hypothetical protein [bacterium]
METIEIPKTKYEKLIRNQRELAKRLEQVVAKLKALGRLEDFEKLALLGRKFAKERGIKPQDVLADD